MNFQLIGIAAIVSFVLGGFVGFEFESSRFDNYKLQVETLAAVQQAKVKENEKADEKITSNIVNDYNNSIASLQHHSSIGILPTISKTAKGIDARTTYSILVDQCTQTTVQLNYLQKWVNEQYQEDAAN